MRTVSARHTHPVAPAVVPPRGSAAVAEFGRTPWRSRIGFGVIVLGAVIILLSASFYAKEPSEWLPDLLMAFFGFLLICLVLVASWLVRPRLPPQKD